MTRPAPVTGAGPEDDGRTWQPPLSSLRLLGGGSGAALLSPAAEVLWWCGPGFDDPPLCWRLLDRSGASAGFPALDLVGHDDVPAAATSTTRLRDGAGVVEVRDALLPHGEEGVRLVRLLRRGPAGGDPPSTTVEHHLRLGGFGTGEAAGWTVEEDRTARTTVGGRDRPLPVRVAGGGRHEVRDGTLVTRLPVAGHWSVLVVDVGVPGPTGPGDEVDPERLARLVQDLEVGERQLVDPSWLPRLHPQRALDALAVVRACTSRATGAVVAAPTAGLPEAPGHDRQFDYRYTWLRDASLSTAVAALLGQSQDARRYLDFVLSAWQGHDMVTQPVLDARGGPVPTEREVPGVGGWGGSRPVRVGNGAAGQLQYDAVGLLVEAVSVQLQVGGRLDGRTWDLVRGLADRVAAETGTAPVSNGIWELREPGPLVDADVGRWLVLDRALWIARLWRPTTRRRRWRVARDAIRARVLAAVDDDGLLPQAYGQDPAVPDASALMAVAFGLLERDDPRADALVDALLARLGAGPYLYRYPPGDADGFSGREGAFLPVSFLAVTALARLGRVEEAGERLDRLCAGLPRLLSEEVDPATGQLLGNTPLVWSHAELARALYVLDSARRRRRWTPAGQWVWRLHRYVRLRRSARRTGPTTRETT